MAQTLLKYSGYDCFGSRFCNIQDSDPEAWVLKRELTVGAVGVAAVAMRLLLDDLNSLSSW